MVINMLETQKYLQSKTLEDITAELGIKTKRHSLYTNLVLFIYDQIESPKLHPVTKECRGLILDENDNWKIICYPFKRFFNYGENGADEIDWNTATVYEKLDGNLVSMWWYDCHWNFSTKGSPDASGNVGDFNFTFTDLIKKTFEEECFDYDKFSIFKNYFFELCSPYTKVVVPHKKNNLYLIGKRNMMTLNEERVSIFDDIRIKDDFVSKIITIDYLLEEISTLDGLYNEGYVVVDKNFNRVKVKVPKYVNLCHLKDSITKNRLVDILRVNEGDEFLTYYEEFRQLYNDYKTKYNKLIEKIETIYSLYCNINDIKEFAKYVNKYKFSGVLFSLYKKRVESVRKGLQLMNIKSLMQILDNEE